QVIVERYWPIPEPGAAYGNLIGGHTESGGPVEDVASVQKSVVSVMVGIAADRALLSLDAPVASYLGAGWSRATSEQESRITVRHLLTMTSGLSTALEFEAPAGSLWRYNTNAYSKLVNVLEAVTGEGIAELTQTWVTEPLDMPHTAWRKRPWVTPDLDANPLGLYASAR